MADALKFQLFYVSFLLLTLFFIGLYSGDQQILIGIDADKIERLTNIEVADPGILGALLYPLNVAYDYVNKAIVLSQISSGIAFLNLLLSAFTFIEIMIIVSILRGN